MIVAAVLGAGVGLGVLTLGLGLRGTVVVGDAGRSHDIATAIRRAPRDPLTVRLTVAVVVATLAFAVTRWASGAVLAGAAIVVLPRVLRGHAERERQVDVADAVAGWAESLRDVLGAASGVEQAIHATAALAPPPVRPATLRLAARVRHERLRPALEAFADEVADPTADLVVTALLTAAERQARDLGAVLGAAAESARHEAALIRRVEAGRARSRTAVRVVTGTTLGFGLLLVLFNRPFLAPYDTALGQLWLLVVGGIFGLALLQMERMARIDERPRLVRPPAEVGR